MPHLRLRALKPEQVQQLSLQLCQDLAKAVGSPEDHFTFELVSTQYFFNGKATVSSPFVEVLWFERPQDVQDQCARLITEKIKSMTKSEEVVVVFSSLAKTAYYENGSHF